MIYLSKEEKKVYLIILNIAMIPFYVMIFVTCFLCDFLLAGAIGLGIIVLNCIVAVIANLSSKSTKYWISDNGNSVTTNYPECMRASEVITIEFDQIVKVEYLRLFSMYTLMSMLHSGPPPLSVFVTYMDGEEEVSKCIGYPALEEITELCKKHGIPLEMR